MSDDQLAAGPIFPNGNTAGPGAVRAGMVEVIAEQCKVIDRLRADNAEQSRLADHWRAEAARIAADNAALRADIERLEAKEEKNRG